jgi:hypothetical protein
MISVVGYLLFWGLVEIDMPDKVKQYNFFKKFDKGDSNYWGS